jgi:hypothetical protein
MSSFEGRDRMDRATAERFLRGDRPAQGSGHPRLTGLLTAASAPAQPAELAGEPAAMAAFAAARHPTTSRARRPSMIQLTLARLLTLKVAAVAVAVAGVGGVALAANAGVLPAPISSHLPGAHGGKVPHPAATASGTPRSNGAAAAPGLAALCREFDSRGDQAHRSRALEEQHFAELVRQAGKKDNDHVQRFCTRFKPFGSPSDRPSGTAQPGSGDRPGAHPGTPPGGVQGDQPGGRPGANTGSPDDRPSSLPPGSAAPEARSPQG